MTILDEIVENTKTKLVQKKIDLPIENILDQLKKTELSKSNFKNNIIGKDQAIIAEIKKASEPGLRRRSARSEGRRTRPAILCSGTRRRRALAGGSGRACLRAAS